MKKLTLILFAGVILILSGSNNLNAQKKSEAQPLPSITHPNLNKGGLGKIPDYGDFEAFRNPMLQKVDVSFEAFGFDDNADQNYGYLFIPPDPIGAAGKNSVIAVGNSIIEARNSGALKWREGLRDFFAPLFTNLSIPSQLLFDPKIVYDENSDRFVVLALEQADVFFGDPANVSRILVAVSKNGNPQRTDWYYQAINTILTISLVLPPPVTTDYWADYPGLELDEEAIYITANMFSFVTRVAGRYTQLYGGSRLWILDKQLYNGSPSAVNIYDPYADGGIATTTMPALVHGDAGDETGTYLVSYSGINDGTIEYAQVIRVDDPLGTPSFFQEYVQLGNIEASSAALPDAPQSGTSVRIEVNDRRALDAVWRDDYLWFTTTILPNSGPAAGQTSAYWVKLNTSDPDQTTLADQGVINADDIAPNTFTFFPSLAVNSKGAAYFGFSASAATIYAGAYVTGRASGDPAGTVKPSNIVHEGLAPYVRTFGSSRNRWGDYSGISLDPVNDDFVWVFNEYAAEPGTPTSAPGGAEYGRWGTAWARYKFGELAKPAAAADVPLTFALNQNYPNPFNPVTTIRFDLPSTENINLSIYNTMGELVTTLVSETLEPGSYSFTWNGRDMSGTEVSSGIYLYKLNAGDFVKSNKMILLK